MDYGSGWILFEEVIRQRKPRILLSILSPRRSPHDVMAYMQQLFIDRTCSIHDRLEFKKNTKSAIYKVQSDRHTNPLYIGDDPIIFGIRADKIVLKGDALKFEYKILANPLEGAGQARFEKRSQVLTVDK